MFHNDSGDGICGGRRGDPRLITRIMREVERVPFKLVFIDPISEELARNGEEGLDSIYATVGRDPDPCGELDGMFMIACRLFQSPDRVAKWLLCPSCCLDEQRPIDLMRKGEWDPVLKALCMFESFTNAEAKAKNPASPK